MDGTIYSFTTSEDLGQVNKFDQLAPLNKIHIRDRRKPLVIDRRSLTDGFSISLPLLN